eukprot:1110527-Amorphochlora_amoeboformis.AAC.1
MSDLTSKLRHDMPRSPSIVLTLTTKVMRCSGPKVREEAPKPRTYFRERVKVRIRVRGYGKVTNFIFRKFDMDRAGLAEEWG